MSEGITTTSVFAVRRTAFRWLIGGSVLLGTTPSLLANLSVAQLAFPSAPPPTVSAPDPVFGLQIDLMLAAVPVDALVLDWTCFPMRGTWTDPATGSPVTAQAGPKAIREIPPPPSSGSAALSGLAMISAFGAVRSLRTGQSSRDPHAYLHVIGPVDMPQPQAPALPAAQAEPISTEPQRFLAREPDRFVAPACTWPVRSLPPRAPPQVPPGLSL